MKSRDLALALIAAPLVLAALAWFDTAVLAEAIKRGSATFDMGGAIGVMTAGFFVVAGGVLLLALLAWRSRSALVGVLYAIVGAYFAGQMWIMVTFGATRNEVPPILPEAIVSALGQVQAATVGSLNAVGIVGAGMAIAGIAVLARTLARR
jgi:hypothetical protein